MGGFTRQQEIELMKAATRDLNFMARAGGSYYIEYMKQLTTKSIDMNVDGSVTPQQFGWIAPEPCYLLRISGVMVDAKFNLAGFGSQATPLTNGLLIDVNNFPDNLESEDFDLLGGKPIQRTVEFGILSPPTFTLGGGQTLDFVDFQIGFAELGVLLYLPKGSIVEAFVQDDLTFIDLLRLSIKAVGVKGSRAVLGETPV